MAQAIEKPTTYIARNHADLAVKMRPTPVNRERLRQLGYGEAAIHTLESGVAISYVERGTPADCTIVELPDGTRFLERGTWLSDEQAWRMERVANLPPAPR
jgi:hypothetical protein